MHVEHERIRQNGQGEKKQKLQKQVSIEQGSHQPDGMVTDRQNAISEKLIRIKAYTGSKEIQITLGSKIKLMFLK